MICSKSPQPLSHFHICPKPKVKLGPTYLIHPAPPSSLDIATTRNPNQFGLTDGILVSPMGSRSHRDGLANSLLPIALFSVPPRYAIGPTEFAWPTLCFAYYPNRSDRVYQFGPTEIGKLCVMVIFCVEAIYPSTSSSFVERAIRTCLHFHHTFLRENHRLMW